MADLGPELRSANELVLEFLLFRGYTRSFRALLKEQTEDKSCAFHSARIVDQLFALITACDLPGVEELWAFLDARFFAHLDREHSLALARCRQRLLKLYVVTCVRRGRRDDATAFFRRYAAELDLSARSGPDSWRAWFALPFLPQPEADPEFSVFFQDEWAVRLREALYNILSTVLAATRLPRLLLLERWYTEGSEASQTARSEVSSYREQLEALSDHAAGAEQRLRGLRAVVRQLVEALHRLGPAVKGADRDTIRGTILRDLGTVTLGMARKLAAEDGAEAILDAESKAQLEREMMSKVALWLRELEIEQRQ